MGQIRLIFKSSLTPYIFHRPKVRVLRALSWTYFKVFEPLGLALWDSHDPVKCLEEMGGWKCERSTYFFGNFQIVTATKL